MKLTIQEKRYQSKVIEINKQEDKVTIQDLKNQIVQQFPKLTIERQRIKFNDKVISNESSETCLVTFGIKDGAQISLKDLGPQISWRTVFLVEYLGPILLHPLFYYGQEVFYGTKFEHSELQKTVLVLFLIHFMKREYETLFVHRFSHGTMPLFNLFKNSFHYHVLSGILPAYFYYSQSIAKATLGLQLNNYHYFCVVLFMFAEVSNFICHYSLRNLRPPGTKERKIPYGYGFELVSCPNYFFEILAWFSVTLLTNHWSIWLFLFVSTAQMYVWAIKKHRQYKKEFPNYPKSRKAIFPFLI
ncbi:hypothetical protein K502DRAFT_337518 [Neoconidiobolus thromboides FSU 785]|nr:hypothetical protein K502DRAFT_337518 [Neoconidiobolus thromboides FSU 785]